MVRWLVVVAAALAGPAGASNRGTICIPPSSAGWTRQTEPGVTVTCGKSNRPGDSRECALLTVAPSGAEPYTAWIDAEAGGAVQTFKRGEVLVVGSRTVRIFTRNTPGREDPQGQPPPFVQPLSKLTEAERAALPEDPCNSRSHVAGMRLDGEDHILIRLEFDGLDPKTHNPRPAIELRVAIADGAATRLEKAGPPWDKDPPPFKRPPLANAPVASAESSSRCTHGGGLFAAGALAWAVALTRRRRVRAFNREGESDELRFTP